VYKEQRDSRKQVVMNLLYTQKKTPGYNSISWYIWVVPFPFHLARAFPDLSLMYSIRCPSLCCHGFQTSTETSSHPLPLPGCPSLGRSHLPYAKNRSLASLVVATSHHTLMSSPSQTRDQPNLQLPPSTKQRNVHFGKTVHRNENDLSRSPTFVC
jgi:hypothetical protein